VALPDAGAASAAPLQQEGGAGGGGKDREPLVVQMQQLKAELAQVRLFCPVC
jgi:hypothetical protein